VRKTMCFRSLAPAALVAAVLAQAVPSLAQSVIVGSKDKAKPSPSPTASTRASARPTSPDEADALGNAAMRGDVATVKALLARGVDPNVRGSLKKSPLRMATSVGCMMTAEKDVLAVVDVLIAGGSDVNEVDDFGLGVLLMTAQKCKASAVTRLLKAGADPEQRSPQGLSPLSMALIVKNYDAAAALIDHGVRLSKASITKIFPEPPEEPELAALVKRATGAQ
jgi:ankyrin repeat protein